MNLTNILYLRNDTAYYKHKYLAYRYRYELRICQIIEESVICECGKTNKS